jgi:predicted DNA-binding protein (MmcQ/YjbR family)
VLIVGIVVLVVDVIIPKYTPRTPERLIQEIDFSNPRWIEEYVEMSVGTFGKDFYVNSAFTYNVRSNKMVVTYASQNSVEEARDYFLELPGAELTGRNDETSLNVAARINDQELRVYNYYSSVSRVFELELTLPPDHSQQVVNQLELAFPAELMMGIPEIQDILQAEVFGGYVRYRYDQLDEFYYPDLPIFSRAYFFSGTETDFEGMVEDLVAAYPDYRYDETQDLHHFKVDGRIISLGDFLTDAGDNVVSISFQEAPPQN